MNSASAASPVPGRDPRSRLGGNGDDARQPVGLLPVTSFEAPATRSGVVADSLRRMILSGEIAPGTRLRQGELATQFQVSTTPVREAFALLSREGLVKLDAHRSVVVYRPSADDVRENYEIRAALESLAASLAATRITDRELDELQRLLIEMDEKILTDVHHHTTVLNPRFHALICRAAARPRLAAMIDTLRDAARMYHVTFGEISPSAQYADDVCREHREIVDALRAGSSARAAAAVHHHVLHNLEQTLSALGEAATTPVRQTP